VTLAGSSLLVLGEEYAVVAQSAGDFLGIVRGHVYAVTPDGLLIATSHFDGNAHLDGQPLRVLTDAFAASDGTSP
jgi:hypothetical protein